MIAAISPRIPSTGRSARRVTSQVTPATTTHSNGSPISMAVRTDPTASCSGASAAPARTVAFPPRVSLASTTANR